MPTIPTAQARGKPGKGSSQRGALVRMADFRVPGWLNSPAAILTH